MEASDVYFENGRRYLRIGTPPLEYLQRHFKPTEYGPEWEMVYMDSEEELGLVPLQDKIFERYIAWRNSERTATTGFVCSRCHEICEGMLGFCITKKYHPSNIILHSLL